MAVAEKQMAARFDSELVNHYTYVIASDGDLMEGISHEAASLAGHLKLNKLIVLYDDNQISIDGDTDLALSDDALKRFTAYSWNVAKIDGHNESQIYAAIREAQQSDKPTIIACRTTIGYGSPNKAGKASSHGAPLGEDEIIAVRQQLDWNYPAFEVPPHIMHEWRSIGQRGAIKHLEWEKRYETSPHKDKFTQTNSKQLPDGWDEELKELIKLWSKEKPAKATRQLSQSVLNAIAPQLDKLVGGSADLTGSNNTKAASQQAITTDDFAGNYLHYGVREHAMAAMMNGMALHKGIIPYGGTFLIFSDYLRPALRLSALMKQQVIYVLTHDSIGLGEDGPTHQPIEHLAALRTIPNVMVFRPADGIEVAECWQLALGHIHCPSVIALTRQAIKPVRQDDGSENLTAKGGYIVYGDSKDRQVTLLATGSEVGLAVEAAEELAIQGINAVIVSMPCWELFEQQSDQYRAAILGTAPRIAIEAAGQLGWDRYIGSNGVFIGMSWFGASAPANQLYDYFEINVENIVKTAKLRIK
jgi:transketolase